MRRDYDDYEDYDNPNFRWVSMVVLLLAVTGFLLLAWYAYRTGAEHVDDSEMVEIKADEEPLKEVPEDKGGMEFPNQDKTIYNVLNPADSASDKVAVITAPEEAKVPTTAAPALEDEAPQDAPVSADRKIAQIIQQAVKDTQDDTHLEEKVVPPAPKEEAKPAEAEKPAEAAPVEPVEKAEPAEPKKVEKTAPAPAPAKVEAKAAPASGAQVQLGAFKSDAEAQAQWKKLQAKYGSELGGLSRNVVKADLGAKGIFYRLRASGFASKDAASAVCSTLAKQKVACFPVK